MYETIAKVADDLRAFPDVDGKDVLCSRAVPYVLEAVCERDEPVGCKLHRHRAADLVLHWCRHLYPDEAEHPVAVDATMGQRIYDA